MNDLAELYVLIKKFEGCRLMPYWCPAGKLTCGYGATGPGIFPGVPWTQAQAYQRLEDDAVRFVAGTVALCPTLRGNKLCAIADFAYNLGLGRLKASTLRKQVNAGRWQSVVAELNKWVWAGGKKLTGLVLRRKAESVLLTR